MASGRVRAAGVSLQHLADMALGTPVVGTVNFSALHTLLHAIIQHLQEGSAVQLGESSPCPPSGEGQERPAGGSTTAVEDGWLMKRLSGRLEVTEEGVCKAMAVLQDLMLEVNTLKDSQREVQSQMQSVAEAAGLETNPQMEQKHSDMKRELEMESLQIEMELIKTQMKKLEEKFEVFHKTLASHPETSNQGAQMSLTSQPSDDDTSRMSGPTHVAEILVSDGPILDTSHTLLPQTQGSSKAEDSAHPVETPHVTEDGRTVSAVEDTQIELSGQQHETNPTYLETLTPQNNGTNLSMTGMGTAAAHGVTLALPTGVTTKDYAMLCTRVDALERDKADRTELGLLQKNTDNLQEKLSNLNREMPDLREGTDELEQLQKAIEPVGTPQNNDHKLEEPSLNATIQEIEKELCELRKIQKQEKPTIEQSAADKPQYLQNQDRELISHIQKSMSQLQEECEQLTRTTGSLIQDHEQKQRHIDILYQTVENLDMKKLDKEMIGLQVDAKADKRTLESKVSRTHFDATTEHLSRMVQELLGKVNAQEQDWQRLLEKINSEMQNKLDRIELEPLKKILEQCWRDLRRQLQEHPQQYEEDKAAGVRKQLMRFHCISCDRPVNMVAPGSETLTIPNIPGLPAHHSNRPYTVYELDQVRQQSRSDRFPQFNDFGYMSSSRHCGGIHTLTFPQRRYARLQASPPPPVQKEDFVGGLKEEVFILGQDGHIYRGRRDNHLPSIRTKGGKGSTVAYQKICDCNVKGEDNFFGCSSALASDIHYGFSKSHLKSARGSELPLPSVKDNLQPTCYQSTKAT